MKKITLLPLALTFAANAAMAANSVDLRVTGTITPSACNISLSGGDFDVGTVSGSALNPTTLTRLPDVGGKTLSITCSGATQVAFKVIDNRASSTPPGDSPYHVHAAMFGLGTDGANNPVGYYVIKAMQTGATINGEAGRIAYSDNSGTFWNYPTGVDLTLSDFDQSPRIYAFDISNTTGQPVPTTSASTELKINTFIQPENTLDTSSEITLDGSATIELVYI